MATPDFEEFASNRLAPLLRYAAVLSGDTEQARDIVQDVMVRAFTRWRASAGWSTPRPT